MNNNNDLINFLKGGKMIRRNISISQNLWETAMTRASPTSLSGIISYLLKAFVYGVVDIQQIITEVKKIEKGG